MGRVPRWLCRYSTVAPTLFFFAGSTAADIDPARTDQPLATHRQPRDAGGGIGSSRAERTTGASFFDRHAAIRGRFQSHRVLCVPDFRIFRISGCSRARDRV
jgi:hypothetical protein